MNNHYHSQKTYGFFTAAAKKSVAVAAVVFSCSLAAAEPYGVDPEKHYGTQVLWGDTHIHTSYSMDSNFMGNSRLSPVQAYQFAKGEAVKTSSGQTAKLARPLDFVIIADHAENLGLAVYLRAKDPVVLSVPGMASLAETLNSTVGTIDYLSFIYKFGRPPYLRDMPARGKIWRDNVAMADEANDPGVFSALVGYEWGSTPNGNNLHRVVVFRDGVGVADQMLPFTAVESTDPVDLWLSLESFHDKTGGEVLAISHNGNLSNGLMFPALMSNGKPLDKDYADLRQRWEPLVEVTQTKGDGEAHPFLSPDDEFADFSTWDKRNVMGQTAKEPWMLKHEYARSALKLGLEVAQRTGVNPYDFGVIGSTDVHTSLATSDDNNFWGTNGLVEPVVGRLDKVIMPSQLGGDTAIMGWQQDAAGYAAVWARSNTRADIYDALARKEVYTSTGPRIALRFFGGWNFAKDAVLSPDYVQQGYEAGVPMGGNLPLAPSEKQSPVFIVSALKDVSGANLDRIQVVKGWLDVQGNSKEKVYDVAWSAGRKIDKKGNLDAVGNTVDLGTATYVNSIGSSSLSATWRDPDFDPQRGAFYYVRVLEIPTPRWVVYDAVHFGIDLPEGAQLIHQERAYSSPIWFVPEG